jgi:hypothetical protein
VFVAHALDQRAHAREVGVTASTVRHAPVGATPALDGTVVLVLVVRTAWFVGRDVADERSGFRWGGRGNATRRGPPALALP